MTPSVFLSDFYYSSYLTLCPQALCVWIPFTGALQNILHFLIDCIWNLWIHNEKKQTDECCYMPKFIREKWIAFIQITCCWKMAPLQIQHGKFEIRRRNILTVSACSCFFNNWPSLHFYLESKMSGYFFCSGWGSIPCFHQPFKVIHLWLPWILSCETTPGGISEC